LTEMESEDSGTASDSSDKGSAV